MVYPIFRVIDYRITQWAFSLRMIKRIEKALSLQMLEEPK